MPSAQILLLESIHSSADEILHRNGFEVYRRPKALAPDELIAALSDIRGDGPLMVGIRSKTEVRAEIFEAVPRLSAIGAFCIGTDQIDLVSARKHGIAVFNAPFSNTRSVAELILGEIIMLSRQVIVRNKAAHEGTWAKTADGSREIRGKVLGIIGYGHIGTQLSVLAEALGMRVVYYDVIPKLPLGNAHARPSLDDVLAEADFVSLHVPDTQQTRGMISARELSVMKKGAYLLNASRGQVVHIEALREALASGHLAGAAIDVFPQEPAKVGDRFETPLQHLDNVILTPHIGGSTEEAQANIGREVSEALGGYLNAGRTTSSVTLPQLDATDPVGVCRLLNVHKNVPGVLSQINRVVADSGINIAGQHLSTREEVGLLLVDLEIAAHAAPLRALCNGIAGLSTSLVTRIIEPRN